jgi:hypothetical protein
MKKGKRTSITSEAHLPVILSTVIVVATYSGELSKDADKKPC